MEVADLALGAGLSATSQLTEEKGEGQRGGHPTVSPLFDWSTDPTGPAGGASPVEVPPEALAEQVEGEGVDAGRGEAEDAGQQRDHQVAQRQVHLLVVEGAVHVEQVVGEPAEGEEEDQHQHDLGQPLPGLHLRGGRGGEARR